MSAKNNLNRVDYNGLYHFKYVFSFSLHIHQQTTESCRNDVYKYMFYIVKTDS